MMRPLQFSYRAIHPVDKTAFLLQRWKQSIRDNREGGRVIVADPLRFHRTTWALRIYDNLGIQLTIERPGRQAPLILTGVFRHLVSTSRESGLTEYFAGEIRDSYPGSIRFFGEEMSKSALARIAMVFQNPEDQLFMPALLDGVTLPLVNRGLQISEAQRMALDNLDKLGLRDLAGRPATKLSIGERKRASIAAALITSPLQR